MACEYCKFSIPGYVAKGTGIGGMCPTELYRLCESGEAAKKVRGVGLKKQSVIAEELRPLQCECGQALFPFWSFCPNCGAKAVTDA